MILTNPENFDENASMGSSIELDKAGSVRSTIKMNIARNVRNTPPSAAPQMACFVLLAFTAAVATMGITASML